MSETNRSKVLEKLKSLDDTDRMLLLYKYSQQTENTYCKFSAAQNIDIITGISVSKISQYHRLRCQPQGAKGAAGYGGRM